MHFYLRRHGLSYKYFVDLDVNLSITTFKPLKGSPYYLFALPPFFWLYWKIQRIFVSTTRQLKRIESVSKSPIYAHFGESINGATTIRAYDHKGNGLEYSLSNNNYVTSM